MRAGTPVYATECIARSIITDGGGVGRGMERTARTASSSGQSAGEECETADGQYAGQDQNLMWLREEGTPTEEAKWIATRRCHRTELETPTLLAHGPCSPRNPLTPNHRRHVAGAMSMQG